MSHLLAVRFKYSGALSKHQVLHEDVCGATDLWIMFT